ncbi:GNAT family N-acetyltransferase [Streptomyces albidoflavus]
MGAGRFRRAGGPAGARHPHLHRDRARPAAQCLGGLLGGPGHTGRGLAGQALAHAVAYARDALGLHRLEAGTLLDNTASQRVLLRAGFTWYGTAPDYLHIAGAWRDHHRYQLILGEVEPRP